MSLPISEILFLVVLTLLEGFFVVASLTADFSFQDMGPRPSEPLLLCLGGVVHGGVEEFFRREFQIALRSGR